MDTEQTRKALRAMKERAQKKVLQQRGGNSSLEKVWTWIKANSFPKQLAYIADNSKAMTLCCGRRGGKTEGIIDKMLYTGYRHPNSMMVYICRQKDQAKRIFWSRLQYVSEQLGMSIGVGEKKKGTTSEKDLSFKLPTGAAIYLVGCRDYKSIDNVRGMGLSAAGIDESELLADKLHGLVDDVLEYALVDYNGWQTLAGTPGKIRAGAFYNVLQNPNWSHHYWTMFDNPYLEKKSGKSPQETFAAILKKRGVTADDPAIQREVFAKWAEDLSCLVYKVNRKNYVPEIPECEDHWLGVDIGWEDKDAIAVWGVKNGIIYLVEEWAENHQTLSKLERALIYFKNKYNPHRMVCDPAGGGKKALESLAERPAGIAMEVAQKTRKHEYIQLINDDLLNGRIKMKEDSIFAHDASKVQWEEKRTDSGVLTGEMEISDRFHSDILDAALYGYRSIPLDRKELTREERVASQKERDIKEWMDAVTRDAVKHDNGLLPSYLEEFESYEQEAFDWI